jgi:hypothetical protein
MLLLLSFPFPVSCSFTATSWDWDTRRENMRDMSPKQQCLSRLSSFVK